MEDNRTGKGQWEAFLQCKFKKRGQGRPEKVIFEQRLDESEAVIGSDDSRGKSIVQAKCTAREKSL